MSDLFKWEDGGGLKHHCPICQTPLSHDKCRTQCLGVHVEWCGRYHTLFRKNWSSRCSACKTTDEQHEKRHREIAGLIAKINKLKAEEDEAGMEPSTPRTPLTARALSAVDGTPDDNTPRTTKKERKKLKKAVKAMERDKVVTSADILEVASIMHPKCEQEGDENGGNGAELAEDLNIRMNLKYNNSTCNTKTARSEFMRKDQATDLEAIKAEVDRLLATFEMDTKASGKEGKLVGELAIAIHKDLVHYHDELRTTAKLRSAFWRWANVKAYRELVDNGKDWDDHSSNEKRSDLVEELVEELEAREEATTADSDEDEKLARNDSVDSGVDAASTTTSLTVPSVEPSPAKKPKPKTLTIAFPPKVKEAADDQGWKQVGKKVLKTATAGKLKMVKNGGLHHLAKTPKGPYGALSEVWAGPVDGDR